ncbi:nucleotidyltransferase domain-containing protein [uncultured Phascolarctobacterium sp.]|jgi:predicted nucleotidyltransferase|uniref:nucleotidyltransferase domain-containing protein n=1 Tax=uncultured Phascolarctobacterium sp. TaxID=512296 RepID=UPI0025EFF6E5|nr:nucleotidyltransferase domain-containing protein [uncultured Phascolarctobacterium sp.]
MEANVSVNVRMKPELKRQFKKFCADMGLSMTEAFNLLAQRAISEYKNPELTKENNTLMLDEIKVLVSSLVKKYNAEYAILFGSYARGEATRESDIDIIIVGGTNFSALDVLAFGEELRELTNKKVDAFELREVEQNTEFYQNILREGVKIE